MSCHYTNQRAVVTMDGLLGLRLKVRRCVNRGCARFHRAFRPEAEGALVLPQQEFGLDLIALVGRLRYVTRASVPEIHAELVRRGVMISERSVTNLLDRYDELVATAMTDPGHLRTRFADQGRVVLAIDGLQPEVGHEVLWVIRDCLSGTVVLARALLSSTAADLKPLLCQAAESVGVPVTGVVSDGQRSIRIAVAKALPGVPHQLCHFHYLREAAHPIFEADRHAKKELKKRIRGIRPIERAVEGRQDAEADLVQGYCAAVRSAVTDDGRAPLDAGGLKLKARLEAVADSLQRVDKKGGPTKPIQDLSRLIGCALQETAPLWPDIKRAFGWVHRAAHILNNTEALPAPTVARRLDGLCGALCRHRACAGDLADGVDHFLKVTRSYRPGLFHCHAVADLPGTNNGLEGLFGSYRYCQRRTTGRRSASSATVVRGPARLVASVTSHLAPLDASDLAAVDRTRWQAMRTDITARRLQRTRGSRFRRDPEAYLRKLEAQYAAAK
ncbi:MAG TPA: ISNCY family transposase [Actinoplanes sp.]|nr:ISNCY family transposase [Actinoplanes sp.]